jgi:hypothetical protein
MNNGYYLNDSERVWAPVSTFALEGKLVELSRHILYLDKQIDALICRIDQMEQNARRK